MTCRIIELPPRTLPDGRRVALFRLERGDLAVTFTDYGARITDLRLRGVALVLGHDRIADYVHERGCLGATVGRYANRIAGGTFTLDGVTHVIPRNNGENALHGGPVGFDRAIWRVAEAGDAGLLLTHESRDGDQGFPGTLNITVRFTLDADGALEICYEAMTDRPTVLNVTNHAYFDLAGEGAGGTLDHILEIAADSFTPVNAALIPTGEIRNLAGTPFDFRTPTRIGARIGVDDEQLRMGAGYDHNFVLRGAVSSGMPGFAARLTAPDGGTVLELFTTEPGLQFYTGNHLGAGQRARAGGALFPHAGLCLETQHFPDSPNQPGFPSTALRPGTTYRSRTRYRFSAAHT